MTEVRHVSVVLFDGFQLLDAFGPIELLSHVPDAFRVDLVAPAAGLVASSQGARVDVPTAFSDAGIPDIVLLPGGLGTRALVDDEAFLDGFGAWASAARIVASVCTGSAVLAAAGLLDGYSATSNKRAFAWASAHGTSVTWRREARWVHDRDRWTSSGIAAGMDMTAALISTLCGREVARAAARRAELEINEDPTRDPFASIASDA